LLFHQGSRSEIETYIDELSDFACESINKIPVKLLKASEQILSADIARIGTDD
jgi:hypothetical protein